MKITSKISSVAGATAILALVLSGCSASDDAAVESPSPEVSASEYVPIASDLGSQIVSTFEDCKAIGELFGPPVAGQELLIDSVSPRGIFCDWASNGETAQYGVQVDVESQSVPSTEGLKDESITVLDDSSVAAKGGVIYAVSAEGAPSYIRIILPEASGVFTFSTGEAETFVEPLKQLMIIE